MFSIKTLLHLLASSAPVLAIVVAHAPPVVAIIGSALLQLIALYSEPPAKAPGGQAGFVRVGVLPFALLTALALAVLAGCAFFRSASADPAAALHKAQTDYVHAKSGLSVACAEVPKLEASSLLKGKAAADADAFCAALAKAP